MLGCPRAHCRGQLEKDFDEKAVYVCLTCARRFAQIHGELIDLSAEVLPVNERTKRGARLPVR